MIHPILVSLALLAPVAHAPVTKPAAQTTQDYAYTFRTTGDDDDHGTSGTVRVHGDRMRIDIDGSSKGGEYMIVTDGGERIFNVHPDRKTIETLDAAKFENVIGIALRGVSPIAKFHVENSSISSQRVGTGEMVLGRATQHMRIRESYDVKITALGFDGGTEHTTVVTDYWVVPGLDLGHNPLFGLLENATTAMVQGDRDYVAKQQAARDAALQGAC